MNLTDVIEALVEERGLERGAVISIVCDGIEAAYTKKFPDHTLIIEHNPRTGQIEVFAEKKVVTTVDDDASEINVRSSRVFAPKAVAGDIVKEPFKGAVGRIEILMAKQVIAQRIRELEQNGIYEEFREREGTLINGMVHKRERAGTVVKMGDTMAFLPRSCSLPEENLRVGYPVRALLKEVLKESTGDHQLILDRASTLFVQRLLEAEIPEVFEGVVEIKKIVRVAGYKSKIVVASNSSDIDPVGTCVGVGGVRIKPILKELDREKIDLLEETPDLEKFVSLALKPAEIDKVEVNEEDGRAVVWLAQDQRSFAIGRMGQNIALASRLTGLDVQLQEERAFDPGELFGGETEVKSDTEQEDLAEQTDQHEQEGE